MVKQDDGQHVWLYTHWSGTELHQTLQAALQRRCRWDDEPYLARIIFCTMVKGHEDGEISFGISTRAQDNEHAVLVVVPDKKHVLLYRNESIKGKPTRTWTMEEFCALDLRAVGDVDDLLKEPP